MSSELRLASDRRAWQRSHVRPAPIFAALLLLATFAVAQQQERTLLERIENPDQTLEFDVTKASSFSGRSARSRAAAQSKGFQFDQKVQPKSFDTRAFNSSKTAWQGDFKFATKEANTKGRYQIRDGDKKAETKEAAVKTARESEKTMATRELHDGKRPFLNRGRSQDEINAAGTEAPTLDGKFKNKWQGDLKQLTIDDIRELLNKNK